MQDNPKKDAYRELVKIVDKLFDIKLKKELSDIVGKLVKEELSKHFDLSKIDTKRKIKESTDSLIDDIVSTYNNTEGKQFKVSEDTERMQLRSMYDAIYSETEQVMQSATTGVHSENMPYLSMDVEPPVPMLTDARLDTIINKATKVYDVVKKKNK